MASIQRRIRRLVGTRPFVLMHDLLGVPAAVLVAYLLTNDLAVGGAERWAAIGKISLLAIPVHGVASYFFGAYRGIWRYASVPDVVRLLQAIVAAAVVVAALQWLLPIDTKISAATLLLYPIMLMAGLSASRLSYRLVSDRLRQVDAPDLGRAIIVGAGRAGDLLVRDMIRTGTFHPVGFVDDERNKRGSDVQGVRILGRIDELSRILERRSVDVVLIAMPSAPRATMDRIVQTCLAAGIECRTLPSLLELADGRVEVSRLRAVTVEDLLGRDPVRLDAEKVSKFLKGKRVLVTGGGGSIGSELCRQAAAQGAAQVLILENGEYNLYLIEQEILASFPDLVLECRLGDVRDAGYIERLFQRFKPQVVFHAAAYKHVPLVEENVIEGATNNVLGTKIVADAAVRAGVERFVLVSTDKTVNPTNVMGTTKRIAEMYCQALARNARTQFVTTRFGNVLASAGSVMPLFARQIKAGGPVTVTHADVTRYFMTIPEAVGLILQAGAMGKGGEIFVLEMGEPVKILDLALKMIQLSGLRPDKDIKIVYTGLRPGEKLFEELFYAREQLVGTDHPKLLLANAAAPELQALEAELAALAIELRQGELAAVIARLRRVVPEYQRDSVSIAPSPSNAIPSSTSTLRVVK